MSKNIEEKIEYLRNCAEEYETTGKSPISDSEYDKLYDEIKSIVPEHPFFNEVGGLKEEHIYGQKFKHNIIMGSLNKSPDIYDFEKWLGNTYNQTNLEFLVEHKVDGLSLSCHYENGSLIRAVTRGNGVIGVDVSENAKYIEGVQKKTKCKDVFEVRGECYKDKKDFYENWAAEYANPRNFTSGAVNQKLAITTKERGISFIAYEVVGKEFDTEEEKIVFLEDNGFTHLNYSDKSAVIVNGSHSEICKKIDKYMTEINREKLAYDIDGIVVKLNNVKKAKEMGTTAEGRRPSANRAVKFPCEQKETEILDVEWSVGRTGAIVPVALLKPVELAGTTVKRVTMHNCKFIAEMGLEIGCTVLIQKSGDIIPYIIRKVKDGTKKIKELDSCPSCSSDLIWDSTKTNRICENINCTAQLVSKIDHWFKTIGVKGIGSGLIDKLVNEAKTVKSISDMYSLNKSENSCFGDKSYSNMISSINSVKSLSLAKLIEALGIGKIGTMSSEITAIANTVEDIDKLKEVDLLKIHGFAETKANNFVKGWADSRKEITEILKYIEIKEEVKMSNKLAGKSFCITGTLSKGRTEYQGVISENGGKVASGVSSKLDFLICGEDSGSKKDKAEKLGVKIISEEEFLSML